MVKTLEYAISKVRELPEAAQEQIAQGMLKYLEDLAALRAEIDIGIAELDAGSGREIDFDALLKELNENHAGRS